MAEDLNRRLEDNLPDPLRESEQEEISITSKARSEVFRDSLAGLPRRPQGPGEPEIAVSPSARLTQTPYELPRPSGSSPERDPDSSEANAVPNPRLTQNSRDEIYSLPQGLAMAPVKASMGRGEEMGPGDPHSPEAMKPLRVDIPSANEKKYQELWNRLGKELGAIGVSLVLVVGGTFSEGTGAEHQSRTREDGPAPAQGAPTRGAEIWQQDRVRIEFRQPPPEVVGPPRETGHEESAPDLAKEIARAIFDTVVDIQEERLQRKDDEESVVPPLDEDSRP